MMKLYAFFTAQPKPDSKLTGVWHCLSVPGGHVFVSEPRTPELYDQAAAHLTSQGGTVLPDMGSGEVLGANHINHPAVAGAGLTVSHNTYTAAKSLAKHFGWPQLDPRLR